MANAKGQPKEHRKVADDGTPVPPVAAVAATPSASSGGGSGDWDVYLGRGSYNSWRPGNIRLHNLVDRFRSQYDGAINRKTKTRIIQEIYDEISSRGRFLVKDDNTERYSMVDEALAKKKIGHTFRDMRRKLRRSGSQEDEKTNNASSSSLGRTVAVNEAKVPANDEKTMEVAPPIRSDVNPLPREPPLPPPPPQPDPPPPPQAHPLAPIIDDTVPKERVVEEEDVQSSSSSIFSDHELLSVLGLPSEYTD